MKKILSIFTSIKATILLLIIFAVSIAIATFIENDYGTETAWALIFRAKWFELLQVLIILNLIINIVVFKMYTLKKLPILLFHISFIFILIGSALTRYYGYEGMISIREGYSENRMLSTDSFLQTKVNIGNKVFENEEILLLSKLGSNSFNYEMDIKGESLKIKYKDLITSATKDIIEDKDGSAMIKFTLNSRFGPEEYVIDNHSKKDLGAVSVFFNQEVSTTRPYFHIYNKKDKLYFKSNIDIGFVKMADQSQGVYTANTEYPFELKRLYQSQNFQLVPQKHLKKAKVIVETKVEKDVKNDISALIVDVIYKGITKEVALFGKGKNFKGYTETINIDNLKVTLEWGSKVIKLPFSLYLKDFIVEKYLGSKSPSSYESRVTLIDKNLKEDHRIYMNNTLIYKGYTFYQSSYDKDEKGTVLSVNNDPGKWPTYFGYFLLIFGLVANWVNPNSRFFKLAKTKYVSATKIATFIMALFISSNFLVTPAVAYTEDKINKNSRAYINSLTKDEVIEYIKKIDLEHSNLFASMLIQTNDGRAQPIDSFAQNVLNKITGGKNLFDLTTNQIFVGMVTKPKHWQRVELFKVKHPKIKELLGIKESRKSFSYIESFTKKGEYKFLEAANEALRTKPSARGKFEKEVLKIDERLNIAYNIFEGLFFRSFPLMNSDSEAWFSAKEVTQSFPAKNKEFLLNILRKNVRGIEKGYEHNNWAVANEALYEMIQYQTMYSKTLPSDSVVEAEILYNELDLFEKLYPVYLLLGLILLIFIFIKLLKPKANFDSITKAIFILFIIGFLVHTFNLGLRWYIAGHAPWSNSYEAMLYISWTIILAGILFAKQSDFALSTTGIFSGITLFVAHLSWLDPQITTLVPVLNSYWLTIHVSVITASYGFLGLSAMLGFIALILYIMISFIKDEESKSQIIINIKEAVRINELSMTVGLGLLIIGNFLGAIWANESWGRYWGWDPKETWTLVTIVVYAAIIHIRYVPKFSNTYYLFSSLSLVAYSTVLMTYFGVNYYLAGLHSYASGDPVPIPVWVYYSITIIVLLIAFAFRNRNIVTKYKVQTQSKEK